MGIVHLDIPYQTPNEYNNNNRQQSRFPPWSRRNEDDVDYADDIGIQS